MMDSKHEEQVATSKEQDEKGRTSRAAGRRTRRRAKKIVSKQTTSKTIDIKLFPDAISIPTVTRTGYSSTLMKRALSETRILTAPEKSYYLVDVQSLFELFLMFEQSIKSNHRRGGWKHDGYYSSIFLRALASRLQRVAVFTDLCTFNQRELVNQPGEIPIFVAHVINQFGVFTDPSNVEIAPYVTFKLIRFILHMSTALEDNQHAGYDEALDPDNWGSWIELCYSEVTKANVVLGCAFRSIGLPFTPGKTLAEISINAAVPCDIYNTRQAVPRMTGPQYVAVSANPTPLLENAVVGGAGNNLPAIGGVHQDILTSIDEQCDAFSSLADPFNGVALPANSVAQYRTSANPMLLETELMELRARYTVSRVSLSPEGSPAPLVVASDLNSNCTASSCVSNVTEVEYLFGIILDHTVIFVTRDLLPFNFAATARSKMRYHFTSVPFTRLELIAKGMRECITRRKG